MDADGRLWNQASATLPPHHPQQAYARRLLNSGEVTMNESNDPLVAIFNSFLKKHGEGRGDVESLAREVFSYPGPCETVGELQSLMAAQMAGLFQGLVDYEILNDGDVTNGILLSVMRATSLR